MPRIALSDIVGRDATAGNRLPDTLKLKLGLERLGYYEPDQRGFTPGADDGLWHGLETYQRDRGLDVDGIALPDGPTVSALNDDLDQTPPSSLITGQFDVPLSPEAAASNRRAVRALKGFRGVGDLPTFAVAALRSGDANAPAEVADLLARSHEDAPEQGRQLRGALAEYLDGDDLSRLDAAVRDRSKAPEALRVAQAADPGADRDAARLTSEWRDKLAGIETNGKPNGGWNAIGYDEKGKPAYGRYQLTKPALMEAKLMDEAGNWTGKNGINSAADYLNNPQAQEAALDDYMAANEKYAAAFADRIGQKIKGVKADITLDDGALMAALHRAGPTHVENYFTWLDSVGGNSRDNYAKMPDWNQKVETRLRAFQGIRYRKTQ